jgi:hypothetical protein
MPGTGARYGINPGRSLRDNLRAGTRYLADLMVQFHNRLDLVLAAYNAGEQAVWRYGGRVPPYPETRLYVPAVLAKYRELKAAAAPAQPLAASAPLPASRNTGANSPPPDKYASYRLRETPQAAGEPAAPAETIE